MTRAALPGIVVIFTLLLLLRFGAPSTGQGSLSGLDGGRYTKQTPEATITTSPSGRIVEPGSRDELGYVLPLDVKRGRPALPRSTPPVIDLTTRRRSSAFSEQRLGPDDGHTQNETTIDAVADTVVAGWNNYTDTTLLMGVARSTDAGANWSFDILGGHDAMSDPVVKAGGSGEWYYAYIARGGLFGGTGMDVFVRRSTDAGATWADPVAVTNDPDFNDKPYMDALGDEVLVGYADFGFSPSKLRASRSIDGGATFQNDVILSVNSVAGNGACPVIDASGTYYVFWRDSWQDSLWVSRSDDAGSSWTPDRGIVDMNPLPSSLPGGFRIVNLPSADADPLTGTLVVVWNDQRFGDPDVLSVRSTDGGNTWSAPVRINDDVGSEAQWFPWVAFDESGIVHVVWYDRRNDGTSIDVYYARSLDGGVSYEPNVRVTDAGFTHVPPWDVAINFLGDYNAVAAANGFAYPFYQDAREGNQDVYVAKIPSVIVDVPAAGSVPAAELTAAPNPFRGRTVVRSESGSPEAVHVFDASGRLMRRLRMDGSGADWDGTDDSGRPVPPGVYFARRVGGTAPALRIVKTD